MKFLLLFLLSINYFLVAAQGEQEVVAKSLQKIATIKSCSYTLYKQSKYGVMRDTSYETGTVDFEYWASDTFMDIKIKINDYRGITDIYNGSEYIKIRRTDSSAYIWNITQFNTFRQSILTNPFVFSIYINQQNLLNDGLADSLYSMKLLNDTVIENVKCYVVLFTGKVDPKQKNGMQAVTSVFFRKADYLPIGSVQKVISNKNLAEIKFEKTLLVDIGINKNIDSDIFSYAAIPNNYSWKQQTSQILKNFIVIEEAIPDLKPEVISKNVSYSNLKGKNLLLVFINNDDCEPCTKTVELLNNLFPYLNEMVIPVIVSNGRLHENYAFLQAQDSLFPSFYNSEQLLLNSKICVYPTFYILNKTLKTVYKSEGYNYRLKEQLMQAIKNIEQ